MLPIGVLALWVVARAAGAGAADLHRRRDRRADPQPARDVLPARPALPRASPSRPSTSASSASSGPPATWRPTRSPTRPTELPAGRAAASSTSANAEPRRPAGLARRQGHQPQGQGAGRDRAADAAGQGRRRHERHRVLRRRPREDARHRGLRADPRLHPVDLHADLRRADRRVRALRDAAGRRHAGGRLPDARAARGRRLRARPAAVQHGDGHRRGRSGCTCSACSGSSPTARPTRSRSGSSSG